MGERMIDFNMNDKVWVRLTDRGRDILREQDRAMRLPEILPDEVDGWSRWQLWDLMNRLGKACAMGVAVPFETTIRLSHPEDTP